jgi:hypothetical protein
MSHPPREEAKVAARRRQHRGEAVGCAAPVHHRIAEPVVPGGDVVDEDVATQARRVHANGHQVVRIRAERHGAAVARDGRLPAVSVGADAGGALAHALRHPRRDRVHEDIDLPLGVTGDEVGGIGAERDDVPVGRDRGRETGTVSLNAVGVDADEGRRPRRQVADEDVRGVVVVAGNEVRRPRGERDEPAVGGQGRPRAVRGGVVTGRPLAHANRRSSLRPCGRTEAGADDEHEQHADAGDLQRGSFLEMSTIESYHGRSEPGTGESRAAPKEGESSSSVHLPFYSACP